MRYLRSLDLYIGNSAPSNPSGSLSQLSNPDDIVPLSNLTRFRFVGHPAFLGALLAGVSTPSLWDVDISFFHRIAPPIVHLPRFITEMEPRHQIAEVIVDSDDIVTFRVTKFSLLRHPESTTHCKPHFRLHIPVRFPTSLGQLSSSLPTVLATVEELRVHFYRLSADVSDNVVLWSSIFQHFPNVKVLRLVATRYEHMARSLPQSHEEPNDVILLPALEEILLRKKVFIDHKNYCARQLAAFHPFVSTRQQAGRPVKVVFDNRA
jgi:hypothetical protein